MNRVAIAIGLLAVACFGTASAKPQLSKCEVCQDLVTAAELFVKFKGWNATTLLAGADKVCGVLGSFEDECVAIINAGGLPFASCIAGNGNTTQCCQDIPAVNFCAARVQKSDRISVQKAKVSECQVCQDFAEVAALFVKFESWNASTIIAEADKLCGFLGQYATECKAVVEMGGLGFATCISGANPNTTQCCQQIPTLNICSSAAAPKKVKQMLTVSKPKITECQLCQDFTEVAELFVKFEGWNATQILAEADKLCSLLGSASAECSAIVKLGGAAFANCIVAGTNTTQCCQAIPVINICNDKEIKLLTKPLNVPALDATPCEICQDAITVAELFVKFEGWNATQILAEADKVCSILGNFASTCESIINAGGLNFTTCITSGGSGEACCQAIPTVHLCSSDAAPALPVAPKITACELCQDVVTVAELLVKFEGWNATQILNGADKICSVLGSLSAECTAIINAGGNAFATCLASGSNASSCCTTIPALHLCTDAAAPKTVKPSANPSECQICQELVTIAELLVKFEGWNATQILNEADLLCGFLGQYAAECKAVISSGGAQLAECVASGTSNTTQCCTEIPLVNPCPSFRPKAASPLSVRKPKLTECQVCQDLVTVAELFVKFEGWNATEILAEADKLCSFLPDTYASTCKAIIAVGGMQFSTCIASGANSTSCCQEIPDLHICGSVAKPKVTTCQICQDFIVVAELFVKFEGWNSTQLLAEADKLCSLTGSLASECTAIVNAGGEGFAECITSGGNTTACCQEIPALNICKSVERANTPIVVPSKKNGMRLN